MDATHVMLARQVAGGEPCRTAAGPPLVRPFRPLLDEVWEECGQRLASLAVGLGLSRDEAADAVQDVLLTALQKPPAIGDAVELRRWLFRVTANRCRLEHRRRGRWRRLWSSLAAVWTGASHPAGAVDQARDDVERALAQLAPDDRVLVALRYFSELNSREIAELVGIPESTVRGRLRTIRRRLAEELAEWSDNA